MLDFLKEVWGFIVVWLLVVGGFALALITIRVLAWLIDVILVRGW